MSAASNRLPLVLGAGIVFVAMGALGWKLGHGSAATKAPAMAEPPKTAARTARDRALDRSSQARQRVNGIRLGGTPEQRMRATIELANTLSPDEFADWIDGGWFNHRDGFELTLFRRIVEERWRLEDPEGFVAWCLEDGENAPAWATSKPRGAALPLLSDWAVNDPEQLKSFFANYPDDNLEAQLISRLAKKHPELAIAHLQEMLKRGAGGGYQLHSAITALTKNSPEAVEAILADLPANLRRQAESNLVGQRLRASFEDEIRSLYERPDGWRLFSGNLYQVKGLSENLLEQLPNLPAAWRNGLASQSHSLFYNSDPEPWFRADLVGAGFSQEQATRIRGSALAMLAGRNPEQALTLLPDSGLDERARLNMISSLFQRAGSDPDKAEEWLAMLSSDAEREAAQKVITSNNQNTTSPQRQFDSPDDWLEAARSSEPENQSNNFQLAQAIQRWNPEQIADLVAEFPNLSSEQRDQIANVVGGNSGFHYGGSTSPSLNGAVVRHLVETEEPNPDNPQQGSRATQLASSNAVQWVVDDPAAASAWVQSLPEGEAKLWAQKNMAATWAGYDPEAVQTWLGTLPADAQSEVREFMSGNTGSP